MEICKVCKKEFKNIMSLSHHISAAHKDIGAEGYYRKYLIFYALCFEVVS